MFSDEVMSVGSIVGAGIKKPDFSHRLTFCQAIAWQAGNGYYALIARLPVEWLNGKIVVTPIPGGVKIEPANGDENEFIFVDAEKICQFESLEALSPETIVDGVVFAGEEYEQ